MNIGNVVGGGGERESIVDKPRENSGNGDSCGDSRLTGYRAPEQAGEGGKPEEAGGDKEGDFEQKTEVNTEQANFKEGDETNNKSSKRGKSNERKGEMNQGISVKRLKSDTEDDTKSRKKNKSTKSNEMVCLPPTLPSLDIDRLLESHSTHSSTGNSPNFIWSCCSSPLIPFASSYSSTSCLSSSASSPPTSNDNYISEILEDLQDEEVEGCGVCGGYDSSEDDPLTYCDGCNVPVHRTCYSITEIEGEGEGTKDKESMGKEDDDRFLCDYCSFINKQLVLLQDCFFATNMLNEKSTTSDGPDGNFNENASKNTDCICDKLYESLKENCSSNNHGRNLKKKTSRHSSACTTSSPPLTHSSSPVLSLLPRRCSLCPCTTGAMFVSEGRSKGGRKVGGAVSVGLWCHVICALWNNNCSVDNRRVFGIPDVLQSYLGNKIYSGINGNISKNKRISKNRTDNNSLHICRVCAWRDGILINCAEEGCMVEFHPICGLLANFGLNLIGRQ